MSESIWDAEYDIVDEYTIEIDSDGAVTEESAYEWMGKGVSEDRGTDTPDLMRQSSISDLARLGYAHGLLGSSPLYVDGPYMDGYIEGEGQWASHIAIARGE